MTTSSPSPAQQSVLEAILDWSLGRAMWQRDALRRIFAKGKLDAHDIQELAELCKQGILPALSNLTPHPLERSHLPANPGGDEAVNLLSVSEVEGVNELAPGQKLEFVSNGVTIIYGDNGAGKSGYARILKRACRARHQGNIEPNIYALQTTPVQATATIRFSVGGVEQPPEKWLDQDAPHAILSAISVFDSDCASVHIQAKNEVAFRPFGLDIPDELARACQKVKEALTSHLDQIKKSRNPIFLKPPWKDTTEAGKALGALKYDTDIKKLEGLALLSDEDSSRLERLKVDLSKDPTRAAAEQILKADNIKRLLDAVALVEAAVADVRLSDVSSKTHNANLRREAACVAAGEAFSGEPLKGVGGEVWRALWGSARRYSSEVAYPGQSFPPSQADSLCVLCQQSLGPEARSRMAGFEKFIQNDAEQQAQQAEQIARTARHNLTSTGIRTRPLRAPLQEIAIQDPHLTKQIRRFLASARLRRYVLLKGLDTQQDTPLLILSASPVAALTQTEASVRSYAGELKRSAAADERTKLESELAELTDRQFLSSTLQTAKDEITRLLTIYIFELCIADTSTNAITILGNNIADTVITPKFRDRFQEEIVKLAGSKIRVETVRSGGKYGSPQYQVCLFAKPDAKVQDILSEGEQTCVALASFLTELATAIHKSTLVFDDPVSSLDHRWRSQVARRLVEEVANRQIVVFTHDLVFANDLHARAREHGVAIKLINVSRGQTGTGIVGEGFPWQGTSIEDRIDKMEKAARAAKKPYDDNREEEYKRQALEIYASLRASWERGLEDLAFAQVVLRHRDCIDTKNLRKVSALTPADCDQFHAGFKKCSNVIDAHDPSRGRNAVPPPPDEILRDIESLKNWVTNLRDRQKHVV